MLLKNNKYLHFLAGVFSYILITNILNTFFKSHYHPSALSGVHSEPQRLPATGCREQYLRFNRTLITSMDQTAAVQQWPWGETKTAVDYCREKRNFWQLGPLAPVSVILAFTSVENVSYIIHTVHSVFQRTPQQLLTEVILVDDASNKEDLKETLTVYMRAVFGRKVAIVRSETPIGLIRARLLGIQRARAPVVVVMDAHMEVQPGWLEPLLYEIKSNPRTIANSFLDWMTYDSGKWTYKHGGSTWKIYFEWSFVFGFQQMAPPALERLSKDPSLPVENAAMMGGTYAMRKDFFLEIGAYDTRMRWWGGENLDLAVRAWLFGGRVVSSACSRMGHLEYAGNRNYREKWARDIHRNYKRFAEVWMGPYKKYFYDYFPHMKDVDVGDLSDRLALRNRSVRDFGWLLKNILPELGVPDRDSIAWGGLRNGHSRQCLDTSVSEDVALTECHLAPLTQGVYWSTRRELRFPIHVLKPHRKGTGAAHAHYVLRTNEYISEYNSSEPVRWHHRRDGPLVAEGLGLCLTAAGSALLLRRCDNSPGQAWRFIHYTERYRASALPETHHVKT